MDALSTFEGYSQEQSDATSAYTQAFLRGPPTWVALPRDPWPKSWNGRFEHPVVPLVLNLYGHPNAGSFWEQAREKKKHVTECGFKKIEGWRSVFWHPVKRAFLIIYVDDFKLSGPRENLAKGWAIIRKGIKTDDPQPVGKCLGCDHKIRKRYQG